ncbi:hypothetical protein HanIR_Chr01g0050881 [Helianthus annuus]|nr:hypothetical protein HanIR_Chr01g0050881 [Helianthus annuus]
MYMYMLYEGGGGGDGDVSIVRVRRDWEDAAGGGRSGWRSGAGKGWSKDEPHTVKPYHTLYVSSSYLKIVCFYMCLLFYTLKGIILFGRLHIKRKEGGII